MELISSMQAVHNCAILKSSSRTLFPLCCPFNRLGIPPMRLSHPPPVRRNASLVAHAKKRNSYAKLVVKEKKGSQIYDDEEEEDEDEDDDEEEFEYDGLVSKRGIEDELDDEEEDEDEDEFEYDEEVGEDETEEDEEDDEKNGEYLDDDIIFVDEDDEDEFDLEDFEDVIEDEPRKTYVGDGGDGGGIAVGSIPWEKEALSIAEELSEKEFNGDFKIFAFKTSPRMNIYIRIEKLSNKYGSPTIDDIEAFSIAYRERLEAALAEEKMPPNVAFEVSSPGVERLLRIPEDLERFKERPMYVKYITNDGPALDPPKELDGIFSLISYDLELGQCIWGIADVKANRTGKGRPLNKKQKEWRLTTPFESLRMVRLHSDC